MQARDSGVDSVLSLPRHGDNVDEDSDGGGVPGLDELRLADIEIPAAGDDDDLEGTMDVDDDDQDRVSFSHYEDIDVLDPAPGGGTARRPGTLPSPADDLYLDPRHPDPGGRTSASLRRQPTSRSDRFGYALHHSLSNLDGYLGNGRFSDNHFPGQTFPGQLRALTRRLFPVQDVSRTIIFPDRRFPDNLYK